MEDQIVLLKGKDRVRARPTVMFGADDINGALFAFEQILNIFLTEAESGYCKRISVRTLPDKTYELSVDDRGLFFDETLREDGTPAWVEMYCELFAQPLFKKECLHDCLYGAEEEERKRGDYDHPFDLVAGIYATELAIVEGERNGNRCGLVFADGERSSDLQRLPARGENGSRIVLRFSDQVFSDIDLPRDVLADCLKIAAIMIPGLRCELKDEKDETVQTYCYEKGLLSYAEETSALTPVLYKEKSVYGRDRYNKEDYHADIRIALAVVETGGRCEAYHNGIRLLGADAHLQELQNQIAMRVLISIGAEEIDFKQIADRVLLLVETRCDDYYPRGFSFLYRARMERRMIIDATADMVDTEFCNFLERHKDLFR